MRLCRNEFARDAIQFCNAGSALAEDDHTDSTALTRWKLVGDVNNEHTIYVMHPPMYREIQDTATAAANDNTTVAFYETLIVDPDSIATPQTPLLAVWRFSIVYSDTWMVPVLYFTVTQGDSGIPFSRSQVLEMLHTTDITDAWDFVSYEEHPMTGEPSFFLHPCQTSDRLGTLLQQSSGGTTSLVSPLLSWTSMILPAVGFRIPTKTFVQVQQWISNNKES